MISVCLSFFKIFFGNNRHSLLSGTSVHPRLPSLSLKSDSFRYFQECVEYCKQIVENKELVNDLVTNGKRKVQERHSCDAECLAYIDIVQKILAER